MRSKVINLAFTALLAASWAVGCGKGGDRLSPGDIVLLVGHPEDPLVAVESKSARGDLAPNAALVPAGTKARVIEDEDADEVGKDGHRRVRVLILEGEQEGVPATLSRTRLKPIGVKE